MSTAGALWANEEINIFREHANRFLDRELAPHVEKWEKDGVVPKEVWRKAGEAGLLCTSVPAEYGGGDGSRAFDVVVIEESSRTGTNSGFGSGNSVHSGICAHYILAYGTEEQKKRWLPKMASGELIGAIAMTEPGTGSDLQGVRTTAKLDGNQYTINGSKTFITNGQNADLVIVVAKTDPKAAGKGISLIVVETEEVEGFRRGRNLEKIGLKSQDTSELFFDDVRVPTENLLGGEEGHGFAQLMQQLAWERLQLAVAGVAEMERAVKLTVEYTKERKAFGQPIFNFQNTQFKLAEMKTIASVARDYIDVQIVRLLEGNLSAESGAMAKWWCSDMQNKVIDECLQLFGGYGYMTEYPIARMYGDARVQKIYGGTNEIMKMIIGRSL